MVALVNKNGVIGAEVTRAAINNVLVLVGLGGTNGKLEGRLVELEIGKGRVASSKDELVALKAFSFSVAEARSLLVNQE